MYPPLLLLRRDAAMTKTSSTVIHKLLTQQEDADQIMVVFQLKIASHKDNIISHSFGINVKYIPDDVADRR